MVKCRLPLCENEAMTHFAETFCDSCMRVTVRNILHAQDIWRLDQGEPTDPAIRQITADTVRWVIENIDMLVMAETDALRKRIKVIP